MDARGRRTRFQRQRAALQQRPLLTPENAAKAAGAYAVFLFLSYALSPAAWSCPRDLECDRGRQGVFWDGPARAHKGASGATQKRRSFLMKRDVGLGVLAADACAKMCQDMPDCAYWMHTRAKRTGMCKLWATDQSPCARTSSLLFPFPTARFSYRGKGARDSVVGGPCRIEAEGGELPPPPEKKERSLLHGDISDLDLSDLPTSECPHLECATAERGFLFDHKEKGHLKSVKMHQSKQRGYVCYNMCRETPGCSIWMTDEKDDDGECKLWTKEQSPCEPSDPYDASTAHHIKKIPGRFFLMGGNCHKLPPRPPKKPKNNENNDQL